MITLTSDLAIAKIKPHGAELCSYLDLRTGTEHIWQADGHYWGRHAPVLFPIVGQVENGEYWVDGKRFEMSQHGFARDSMFEVDKQTANTVSFSLRYSEESLLKYPFKFELLIAYRLMGSKLSIDYTVKNLDTQTIHFQLGAHPGFCCPFDAQDTFEDYEIRFNKKITTDRLLFADGLLTGEVKKDFLSAADSIPLHPNTFKDDAIILETDQIDSVSLVNQNNQKLTVQLTGWPLLGIWSKPGANAPFVCIEPWYGVASLKGGSKELKDKKAIQSLKVGEVFEAGFSVWSE